MDKITHSIKEYIQKNGDRANLHWKVTKSGARFKHNNKWQKEEFFDKLYPKYQYRKDNGKGENPNTKSFL